MPLPLLVALSMLQGQTPAPTTAWDISKPLAKSKITWTITSDVKVGGGDHNSTLNHTMDVTDVDKDGTAKVTVSWSDITVDGAPAGQDNTWKVLFGARGSVDSAGEEDDDIRRMLSPTTFVKPEKPVAVGDKWTFDLIPKKAKDRAVKYEYEVKAAEKLKDVDTLKINYKFTEKGSDGTTAEGDWWIAKDGHVVKFDIKVKNWIVPFAGADGIEGHLTGVEKAK